MPSLANLQGELNRVDPGKRGDFLGGALWLQPTCKPRQALA